MFFNLFTYSDTRGWSFDYFVGREYDFFSNFSGQALTWDGIDYTAPNYLELPWGLGAWGAGTVRQ